MFLLLLMLLFVVARTCNMLWAAENSSCGACVVKLMIAVGVYGGEVWCNWQQWARNWMACRTSGQCSLSGLVWSFLNCSMLEMCAWNLAAAAAFCTTFHQMFLHIIPPKQTLFDTGSVKFEHWVCIFARRLCTWSNLGTSCDVGNFPFVIWQASLFPLAQCCTSMLWGVISDRTGRKVQNLLMSCKPLLTTTHPHDWDSWMLLHSPFAWKTLRETTSGFSQMTHEKNIGCTELDYENIYRIFLIWLKHLIIS